MPSHRSPSAVRRTLAGTAGIAAGALSLSLASVPLGAPASAARGADFRVIPITVPVTIGPKDDIRCKVSADLYVPKGVNRRSKAPSVLLTNGFGGSKRGATEVSYAAGFAREGYVALAYSGLGFGGSGCKIYLDSPAYDGKAGSQLVDVLAGAKRYVVERTGERRRVRFVQKTGRRDPRVGMIGGSYGGQIQYAVAGIDRRVDALIPTITWNDLSYSLAPNNTSLTSGVSHGTPGVSKMQWVDLFSALGVINGITGLQDDPGRVVGCPNFDDRVCTAILDLNVLGYPTASTQAIAARASVARYIRRIKAPTLLVQGQADTLFNLQESVATFQALSRQGTPTKLIWQSFGHSDSSPEPGEYTIADDPMDTELRDSHLGRRFLAWMDRHVAGQQERRTGARFSYFRDWVSYDTSEAAAGRAVRRAYATRGRLPGLSATMWLSGAGDLVDDREDIETGSQSHANASVAPTSYSETSALEGSTVSNPPSDATGTFAAWTSARLARAADWVGSAQLTVHLDAPVAAGTQAGGPAGKLVLFAKVYDIAPDGTKTLKNRLISPVRVADVTEPVEIALPGIVHRFATGHRIQVVLAASDFAYAGNRAPQPVTVTTSPASPGTLRMPLTSRLQLAG